MQIVKNKTDDKYFRWTLFSHLRSSFTKGTLSQFWRRNPNMNLMKAYLYTGRIQYATDFVMRLIFSVHASKFAITAINTWRQWNGWLPLKKVKRVHLNLRYFAFKVVLYNLETRRKEISRSTFEAWKRL